MDLGVDGAGLHSRGFHATRVEQNVLKIPSNLGGDSWKVTWPHPNTMMSSSFGAKDADWFFVPSTAPWGIAP